MRARQSHFAALLLAALSALPACRGCFDSAGDAGLPASLSIPVEIDKRPAQPIDGALLARVPPDFIEGERRAWRLRSLLGDVVDRPGTLVEVEDAEGKKTVLTRPGESREGREAVLAINRMGEARVALIAPSEPFPPFHGRGGNRGRSGDPSRIREVRRITLRLFDAAPSASAAPQGEGR